MIGPATTSDEQTSSAVISGRTGFLHGFEVLPPPSGLAKLRIYDSDTADLTNKKVLAEAQCAAGNNSVHIEFMAPRVATKGIYANYTGSSSYTVGFSLG